MFTEGSNATFECELGTDAINSKNYYYLFEYYSTSNLTDNDTLTWSTGCIENSCIFDDSQVYHISQTTIEQKANLKIYRFTFQVNNVTLGENGSVFTCSVVSETQIQWQRSANLTVTPRLDLDDIPDVVGPVAALLCFVSVTALGVTVGIFLGRRKWKRKVKALEADQGMIVNLLLLLLLLC